MIIEGLILLGAGSLVLQGLRKIPADPPTKAVVTRFGKRLPKIKDEGWRFFPGYPYISGYIPVDMTRKNKDLEPNDVRTPDMAEISIRVSVTWRPDPENLIEYLNSGGESGVNNILSDMVESAVREMAANPEEEPFSWEEAVKMRDAFLARIVESILAEKGDGADYQKIIASLRRGNGDLKIKTLGIILSRLNVTNIKPKGELAKAAELAAKEERERKAEEIELRHVAERIKALIEIGFSPEQALEIVQVERGKAKKDIDEKKFNVSPETRAMIEKIGPEIIKKFLEGRKNA